MIIYLDNGKQVDFSGMEEFLELENLVSMMIEIPDEQGLKVDHYNCEVINKESAVGRYSHSTPISILN